MKRDTIWALNAVDNCRQTAYFAKNKKFAALWTKVADRIELDYLSGEPWPLSIRTYDGTVE